MNPGGAHFFLPEPPSANRWWRKFRNRMVLSPAARTYKTAAAQLVEARRAVYGADAECIPAGVPIGVDIVWVRQRKAGDLDKRLGVILDAMQGILYANDNQIVVLRARRMDKHETVPNAAGTIRIEVWRV